MKHLLTLCLAIGLAGFFNPSKAATYGLDFTCPSDPLCNGATYSAELFQVLGNDYYIQVTVDPTAATPSALGAIALKTFYSGTFSFTNFVASGGTNSPTFTRVTNELTANGCSGGSGSSLCAFVDPGIDPSFSTTTPFLFDPNGGNLTFQFYFTVDGAGTFSDLAHLKYQYLTFVPETTRGGNTIPAHYDKIGSLGSYDITLTSRIPPNEIVPEPSTFALIGLSCVGLGYWRRKRS